MTKPSKPKASKFQRMSKILIWIMLFAMVGSAVISVLYSLFANL